ncbi:MAG TPA: glucose dehydrogenase [Actinobacteria bacterium]|nr:glucose dehydrogenase [Actinomycetota bacterium]
MGFLRFGSLVAAVVVLAACRGGVATDPSESSLGTSTTLAGTSVPPSTTTTSKPSTPSTSAPTPTTAPPSTVSLEELSLGLEEVAGGFDQPVFVTAHPGGGGVAPGALVVVDQPGRVWLVEDDDRSELLDLREEVSFEGERGLLGLAFAPDGRLFVDYTDRAGDTRIVEYAPPVGGRRVDPASARTVLTVTQPAGNHNGGMIAFGPDGYLWVGMGDGGAADDRFRNGQDQTTLLGAMLRIDVDPDAPEPYGIPPDNPWADGDGGAPEVFAIGLRNPWRWAFDGTTLWIADVGQGAVEEVHRLDDAPNRPGVNFGWPIWEGDRCFEGPCDDPEGFEFPVAVYTHDEGCSIIGGYVYRGRALPELDGHYFYADFCSGLLRSIAPDGTVHDWTDRTGPLERVTSFGVDADGELLATFLDGRVVRLVRG